MGTTMSSSIYSLISLRIMLAYSLPVNQYWNCVQKVATIISNSKNVPPLRFPKYSKFEDHLSEKENKKWKNAIKLLVLQIQNISTINNITKDDYTKLHRALKSLPRIGTLRANHIIAIAAIVGIVPLKMFNWVEGGAERAMI